MNILIAISHRKLRNTLAFALESQLMAEVTIAATAGEAIEPLVRGREFQLVICDHPAIAEPLVKFVSQVKLPTPIAIVLSEGAPTPEEYLPLRDVKILGYLQGNDVMQSLLNMVELLQNKLPHAANVVAPVDASEEEFVRVAAELVRDQDPLTADLYLRLGTAKYLKVVPANERFSPADREKYFVQKQVDYLYVRKGDSVALLNRFNEALKKALSQAETDPESAERVSADIQNATLDMIERLGVTPEVKDLIKSNIILTVKAMGSHPRLRTILSKISANRDKYISSHSTALAQLCCALAAAMDWGSPSTFQKLTMVAFLHDIVLTNQKLAMVQSKEALEALTHEYTKAELREYLLHPARAAEVARQFDELPSDVDSIIAQHHERPDGSGFPRGLSKHQIAPLAALFIVAHDVVSAIFDSDGNFVMENFLDRKQSEYAHGSFRKIFAILRQIKLGE